jgi:hypothetical protein
VKNYGPYLERARVGVVSDIRVDGAALRHYSSVPGLNGEQRRRVGRDLLPGAPASLPYTAAGEGTNGPLTWHTASFETPAAVTQDMALALDISATSLVKGALWVNDFMLGRYWNIIAGEEGGACGKGSQSV